MANYDFFIHRKPSRIAEWMAHSFHKQIIRTLKKWSPSQGAVIEIGTGRAELALKLRELNFDYHGYEPAPLLASHARDLGFAITQEFVPPLLQSDSSASALLMSHMLEHLENKSKACELLIEVKRCLVTNGICLIVVPDILDWKAWFWESDYTHQTPFSSHSLKHMLEDHGFEILENRFVWGALPWFPGALLNAIVKFFLFLLTPWMGVFYTQQEKLLRLRSLFGRCVWISARKRP